MERALGAGVGWDPHPFCILGARPSPVPLAESSLPIHAPSLEAWKLRNAIQPQPSGSQHEGGPLGTQGQEESSVGLQSFHPQSSAPVTRTGAALPMPHLQEPTWPQAAPGQRHCWDISTPTWPRSACVLQTQRARSWSTADRLLGSGGPRLWGGGGWQQQ